MVVMLQRLPKVVANKKLLLLRYLRFFQVLPALIPGLQYYYIFWQGYSLIYYQQEEAPPSSGVLPPSNPDVAAQLHRPPNVVSPIVQKCVGDVLHALEALQIPRILAGGEPFERVTSTFDTLQPQLRTVQQQQT